MKITRYRLLDILHRCIAALPWVQAVRTRQHLGIYQLFVYPRGSVRHFIVTIEEGRDE